MDIKRSDRFHSALFGFLGAGVFWALAHAEPAVAQISGSTPAYLKLQAATPGTPQSGHSNVTGTVIAGAFRGDGSGVTALSAANIVSGILQDARLSGEIPRLSGVNNFTNANNSFAGDGQLLTNLSAAALKTGTVPDARMIVNGDLSGVLSNNVLKNLRGVPVSSSPPAFTEVLKYNGSAWEPLPDSLSIPCSLQAQDANTMLNLHNNATGTGVAGSSAFGTGVAGMAGSTTFVQPDCGVSGTTSLNGGSGVAGTALGPSQIGGRFQNIGQTVKIADFAHAVTTNGLYWRDYTPNDNCAAVPIAYGCINGAGTIAGGTGNFSVVKAGTGLYDITIDGDTYSNSSCSTSVSVCSNSARFATVANNGGVLRVSVWTTAGANIDTQFQFTVYKVSPSVQG